MEFNIAPLKRDQRRFEKIVSKMASIQGISSNLRYISETRNKSKHVAPKK